MSAYASELSMRREEIRMRINSALGQEAIMRIEFFHQHLGFDEKPKAETPPKRRPLRPQPAGSEGNLLHEIEHAKNNELRAALEAATKTYYQKGNNDG